MEAFGVYVDVPEFGLVPTVEIPGLKWSAIFLSSERPDSIAITVSLPPDIPPDKRKTHLASWGTLGESSGDQNKHTHLLTGDMPFLFNVPVAWGERETPYTRNEPLDNFRVLVLGRTGHFWQTEIGLATRGREIFLTAQNQWAGWALEAKNKIYYVPSQPQHNYPGVAPYSALWSGLTEKIEEQFRNMEATLYGYDERTAPKWNPPPAPAPLTGFPEMGVVLYFSPIAGIGRVLSQKGVEEFLETGKPPRKENLWFLHFRAFSAQDNPVAVAPMIWLHAEVGKAGPGQHFAPILSCKVAG